RSPPCSPRPVASRRSPGATTRSRSPPPGTAWRSTSSVMSPLRRGRVLGVVLLALLTVVAGMPVLRGRDLLRFAWFDALRRLAPRVRVSAPVVIVDVDGKSLARHGQWPWPRTLLAELIDRVSALEPAAIGIDIVMPEADRLSPQRLPALLPAIRPELAARLM